MTESIGIIGNRNSKIVYEKYTVDQALEGIGYGPFHRKLCLLSGSSIGEYLSIVILFEMIINIKTNYF